MTDAEFLTYLSAWEVARKARDQDPTSANIARARSAREAYLAALDIQRGDARELTVEGPAANPVADRRPGVEYAPGVPFDVRAFVNLPDVANFYRYVAPPPEPRKDGRETVHVTFTEESNAYRVTIPGTPAPKTFGHFTTLVEALGLSDWVLGGPWPETKKVLGYLYDVGFPAPPGTTPTVKDRVERAVTQDQEARDQVAPPVVAPLYRGNPSFVDDLPDDGPPEGPNPDDMVPGPDVPDWFMR